MALARRSYLRTDHSLPHPKRAPETDSEPPQEEGKRNHEVEVDDHWGVKGWLVFWMRVLLGDHERGLQAINEGWAHAMKTEESIMRLRKPRRRPVKGKRELDDEARLRLIGSNMEFRRTTLMMVFKIMHAMVCMRVREAVQELSLCTESPLGDVTFIQRLVCGLVSEERYKEMAIARAERLIEDIDKDISMLGVMAGRREKDDYVRRLAQNHVNNLNDLRASVTNSEAMLEEADMVRGFSDVYDFMMSVMKTFQVDVVFLEELIEKGVETSKEKEEMVATEEPSEEAGTSGVAVEVVAA